MDSLTQIVLGAAVGELVLGKKIGNKAQLWGAIAGTLPDLDVLVTMNADNDLTEFIVHRSYSHALFTHILAAFPFAWITYRLFKRRVSYKEWYWLWFLGFATHAILDSFTTYGTKLLLPFTNYLVGFNNISVIDPLYTIPFMIMLIVCLFMKRDSLRRRRWALWAVYISSGYMLLTFGVKGYVHYTFTQALNKQQIHFTTLSTSPTIFNNALWAGMAYDDSTLSVGEYSVFQGDKQIHFAQFKRHLELEKEFASRELDVLKWFSQGPYMLERADSNTLNFYIAKWGRNQFDKEDPQGAFIFYYQLKKENGHMIAKAVRPDFKNVDFKKELGKLWDRIWHNPDAR